MPSRRATTNTKLGGVLHSKLDFMSKLESKTDRIYLYRELLNYHVSASKSSPGVNRLSSNSQDISRTNRFYIIDLFKAVITSMVMQMHAWTTGLWI